MKRAAELTLEAAESATNGHLQEFQEETHHVYFNSASTLSEEEAVQQATESAISAEFEAPAATKRRMSKVSTGRAKSNSPMKPLTSLPATPEHPPSTSPGKRRPKKL